MNDVSASPSPASETGSRRTPRWNQHWNQRWNSRYLLFIAGLGGLLYGIDVGIIAGALPYLETTSGLTAQQLSIVVAAVLLGSVISTLFAGLLADLMGRKKLMTLSGVAFVASIPMIALAHGFGPLVLGRLLQGVSAGFVGVVVPLYLAECLDATNRGRGTGLFQWLLTLGIFAAALIAWIFSFRVARIEQTGNAAALFAFKDFAWRSIFWISALPGALFVFGSLFVPESPRWLFRRGRKDAALNALKRTRTNAQAALELKEMEESEEQPSRGEVFKDSLFSRRYVVPFLLACVILACNQATGVNSIIGYNATILIQAGLSDASAHLGYVGLTLVNFLMTMVAVALVDKKGRKFLLSLGSAGIIVSLLFTGMAFRRTERQRVDVAPAVQALVSSDQTLDLKYGGDLPDRLLSQAGAPGRAILGHPSTLIVIYAYGDFRAATQVARSTDALAQIRLTRESCVPKDRWAALAARITHPTANAEASRHAPLRIEHALIAPVPTPANGWLVAALTFVFMAFFAMGPGVCVWLALSELMPTRIRSNGMSIALLINQAVSTAIAAIFLPTVGAHGYGALFFVFAGCTAVYFITATFFLPETKGKTLEEIEAHFQNREQV
ncbi:MAG TPA: MFS transporter [Holophaga sp.]|jgi:MFS transporter, SP family, solute carrier family 2 (myo-inositol transporter), member 13|nr:MFS transporter [Holophaga sp.]